MKVSFIVRSSVAIKRERERERERVRKKHTTFVENGERNPEIELLLFAAMHQWLDPCVYAHLCPHIS